MKRVKDDSLSYPGDGYYYLDGEPFTGVGFILNEPEGWVEGETEYRDGLESGFKREWAGPGKLLYEGHFRGGVLHGKKRRWLRNGDLTEEGDYEYGIPIREKTWDEDGNLIDEYELQESEANYQLLQKYRRLEQEQSGRGRI